MDRTRPRSLVAGSPAASAVATPVALALSRKAQLRHVAVRDYARLRHHARNCTDCVPGATDADPPRINRVCRFGVVGKAEYERAYQTWVDCPEEDGS
jgi:hypothetical protein